MLLAEADPRLTWDVVTDIRQAWSYPFMVNAFRAGSAVAVISGLVGWFMVLRRQTFAGHTIAMVGFPGAAGATLIGVSAAYGYLTFCLVAALTIALLPRASRVGFDEESALTGTVQAFALACGYLFVTLYKGFLTGVSSLLFGNILGISDSQVLALVVIGVTVVAFLAVAGRKLLFASVDPRVAAARGVPVRALSISFLLLLGLAAAGASQITGTLLVLALLVTPASTAQVLAARPVVSLALTVTIGLCITWLGLTVAFYSDYPIGFFVTTFGFACYTAAVLVRVVARQARRFW